MSAITDKRRDDVDAREEITARRPERRPTHPGTIIRDTLLPACGLSVAQAATRLDVGRTYLHEVAAGRSAITPELAHRLGRFAGNGPDLWINMQVAHDMHAARERLGDALERVTPLDVTDASGAGPTTP